MTRLHRLLPRSLRKFPPNAAVASSTRDVRVNRSGASLARLVPCVLVALVTVLAPACSKDKGGSGAGGASPTATVIAAWKAAKLTPSEFKDVAPGKLGGKCQAGTVDGLETTLCEYPDDKTAHDAEAAGLDQLGDVGSGTALSNGKLLLVVADRKKVDPEGRRLNLIAKTFRAR